MGNGIGMGSGQNGRARGEPGESQDTGQKVRGKKGQKAGYKDGRKTGTNPSIYYMVWLIKM